jgi:hypothetical protein
MAIAIRLSCKQPNCHSLALGQYLADVAESSEPIDPLPDCLFSRVQTEFPVQTLVPTQKVTVCSGVQATSVTYTPHDPQNHEVPSTSPVCSPCSELPLSTRASPNSQGMSPHAAPTAIRPYCRRRSSKPPLGALSPPHTVRHHRWGRTRASKAVCS